MFEQKKSYVKLVFILHFLSMIYEVTSIVGGQTVYGPEFPYIVSLRDLGCHFCGGSILNIRWIITASHCLDDFWDQTVADARLTIHAGTLLRRGVYSQHVYRMIYRHVKDINEDLYFGQDIVLIKVDRNIEFDNPYVGRINIANHALNDGDRVTAAGWGYSSFFGELPLLLQKVTLNFLGKRNCSTVYGETLMKYFICTYDYYGVGTSNGDSGGPIVSSSGELVGIISHTYEGAAIGYPTFHTDVHHYRSWINFLITYDIH